MYDEAITFQLICSCGNNIHGIFLKADNIEILTCNKCNLIWDIKKLWKDDN